MEEKELLDCLVIHETDKAVFVELYSGEKVWIPKSQLDFSGDDIYVAKWFIKKLGL